MTKADLILEKNHAKFQMEFYRIHRFGSYRAMAKYQGWLTQYNHYKELCKKK